MQIYLLRHGIAEDAPPGHPDSERALTDEGREKLSRVLKRARAAGVSPSLICSSPYKRAIETADVAVKELGYQGKVARTRALLPNAGQFELWEEIRTMKDEPSILLAGHEPMMGAMVAFLLGSPNLEVDMKKAALVRVDCEHFGAAPRGVLKWMLTPALA